MLSFAAASAAFSPGRGLADAAGHDHGAAATTCATYEFGGIYAVPTGAGQVYTFSAPMVAGAYPEPTMKVVILPVADATEATMTSAKAEGVDGMGHTPCTIVEPGGTVVAKDHACSEFHMEGASPAVYTLSNTELTTGFVAVFYQHSPAELSATFSEATAGALTPAVQVPARPCPAAAAGCTKAYEWGAIFATPATAGTYTWTAYKKGGATGKWAESKMKIVALPVADAKEATLAAAKAEAIDGMGHTPCTDVEPGETIVPGDHKCSVLHVATLTLALAPALTLALTLTLTPTRRDGAPGRRPGGQDPPGQGLRGIPRWPRGAPGQGPSQSLGA